MQFSFTIPGLFYDVIARIVPGFLCLLLCAVELHVAGYRDPAAFLADNPNSVQSIWYGLGFVILCYLVAWALRPLALPKYEKRILGDVFEKGPDGLQFVEKYHAIRRAAQEVGFRMLKSRAEARMLETLRTGMIVCVFLSLACIGRALLIKQVADVALLTPILLLSVLLAVSFWRSELRAWELYKENVETNYRLFRREDEPPVGTAT